jgi:hypothetical protein
MKTLAATHRHHRHKRKSPFRHARRLARWFVFTPVGQVLLGRIFFAALVLLALTALILWSYLSAPAFAVGK